MAKLKILKAYYYDSKQGYLKGTEVTDELNSLVKNDALFFQGIYNKIFPDHFKSVNKKLRIELKYRYKKFVKIYNENDLINIPLDLNTKNNFLLILNNPWLVAIIGGVIAATLYSFIFKQPEFLYKQAQTESSDVKDANKNNQDKKNIIPEAESQTESKSTATKLDESIFSIVYKHEQNEYSSALDKQVAFKKYSGAQTSGERAFIKYIQEDINGKMVDVLLGSEDLYGTGSVSVYCFFKIEWLQELSKLNKEDLIEFSGKVGNYSNGIVYLSSCELK